MAEYIDREALLNAIETSWHNNPHAHYLVAKQHNDEHRHFMFIVANQPAADVAEVKHGEWILSESNPYGAPKIKNRTIKMCSLCGWQNACRYAYCPSCGAKMDGKETDHE